jgi:hypothetical protein
MSKGLRLTEKWMQRGLWLVALVFACFLIGLGGKVVDNLSLVEPPATVESFIDPAQASVARTALSVAEKQHSAATAALEQASGRHQVAVSNTRTAQESFTNWLATRSVTARPEQDPALIARTRELDTIKAAERTALAAVEA